MPTDNLCTKTDNMTRSNVLFQGQVRINIAFEYNIAMRNS